MTDYELNSRSAVAERPGIGGAEWNQAIEEHRDYLAKKFASDASGLQKALKQVDESLSQWIVSSPLQCAIRGAGQRIGEDLRSHGALGEGSSRGVKSGGRDEGAICAIGVSGR